MVVEYKGVDITEYIEIDKCWLDQYAESHGDTLKIRFKDIKQLWDIWSPQIGDTIRVYDDHVDSGIQYVRSVAPSVGKYEIDANSMPTSANIKRSQGWQQVTKLQLAKDIAKRHDLELKTYGITDHKFYYLRQENETDFSFFKNICELESDSFLIYDGSLVLYSEEYIEGESPTTIIEATAENKPDYIKMQDYTALSIHNSAYEYTYGTDTSRLKSERVSIYIDSPGTAERYASNLLKHYNKYMKGGTFYSQPLADGLTAGSVITLKTEGASSFDGDVFVYHTRHDLKQNKTKVFFRNI